MGGCPFRLPEGVRQPVGEETRFADRFAAQARGHPAATEEVGLSRAKGLARHFGEYWNGMNPERPSSPSGNRTLGNARSAKQDEFYTQLDDIGNELRHYREHLRGKVVLCNCDDPYESNFFRYFALNFNALGLKRLVATSYQGSPIGGDVLPFEELAGLRSEDRGTRIEDRGSRIVRSRDQRGSRS